MAGHPMEKQMYRQSIQNCTAEPSFFYLIMAAACFRRAAAIGHPNARGALRDVGREYLNQAAHWAQKHG
jgi:hypothetical protein